MEDADIPEHKPNPPWLLSFSAGLAHQISATIDALVGLDSVLQCLLQGGWSSTTGEVKWFNATRNNGEKQNEGGVEMKKGSAQLIFASVSKAHTGTYTCRMEKRRNASKNRRSEQIKHGERHKPTDTHGSGEKGLRKGEERGKRGRERREGGLLRRCEVTSAQRFGSDSEVLQREH